MRCFAWPSALQNMSWNNYRGGGGSRSQAGALRGLGFRVQDFGV